MSKTFLIKLVAWAIMGLLPLFLTGQERFVTPIAGTYGDEYILVNYVDWGLDGTILDAHCLSKTYDGHQGSDFVIRNFALMDTGVAVLAVDTGVVIYTQDGIFDREKTSDPAKGLGNYIGITHSGGYQTYYGHLRKNSLLVGVGDTVLPGQPIGFVGSSGNSVDPHLHFELWYDSLYHIDPFSGPCGNGTTFWKEEIEFDSLFHQWVSGMVGFVPDLDTLREEPLSRSEFDQQDEAISYWSLLYGLRKEDLLEVEWITPAGLVWYTESLELVRDWWYFYYWTWINVPAPSYEGEWIIRLRRNGWIVEERPFYLSAETSTISSLPSKVDIKVNSLSGAIQLTGPNLHGRTYQLLDVQGKRMAGGDVEGNSLLLDTRHMVPGMYILVVETDTGEPQSFKVVVK